MQCLLLIEFVNVLFQLVKCGYNIIANAKDIHRGLVGSQHGPGYCFKKYYQRGEGGGGVVSAAIQSNPIQFNLYKVTTENINTRIYERIV